MLLPVSHKVDRRLSGWLASFLSRRGRLTLINSVLADIPSYFMSCFPWPKESLAKLDGLLRAFFWQGKNKIKGGQCLMAWDRVTLPRANGGLKVRNLQAHNQAMICKFVAKVLRSSPVFVGLLHSTARILYLMVLAIETRSCGRASRTASPWSSLLLAAL